MEKDEWKKQEIEEKEIKVVVKKIENMKAAGKTGSWWKYGKMRKTPLEQSGEVTETDLEERNDARGLEKKYNSASLQEKRL